MQLNQVTVPALDVARAAAFYQQLGLRLIVKALPHYVRLECPGGGSTFSVHQVEELPHGEGISVYFECADLDERYERLHNQGVDFEQPPTDQSWMWREARLRDPAGNRIILYWAGEHRRYPPWRVGE